MKKRVVDTGINAWRCLGPRDWHGVVLSRIQRKPRIWQKFHHPRVVLLRLSRMARRRAAA